MVCSPTLKQPILKTLDKFNTGIGQLLDGLKIDSLSNAVTLTPYYYRLIGEFNIYFEKRRQLANTGLNLRQLSLGSIFFPVTRSLLLSPKRRLPSVRSTKFYCPYCGDERRRRIYRKNSWGHGGPMCPH